MVYTVRFFFSSKCSLFHNSNLFGSCIIHILYTGVLKLKKKFRRQKVNDLANHLQSAGYCIFRLTFKPNIFLFPLDLKFQQEFC